jgi:hypothetical protein
MASFPGVNQAKYADFRNYFLLPACREARRLVFNFGRSSDITKKSLSIV